MTTPGQGCAGVAGHTPLPKLQLGSIEAMSPDGSDGILFDEAIIFFEGDEDSHIKIECPGALRLAEQIVRAVNRDAQFEALVKALEEILSAEKDFREGMPDGWEGDPLTDACANARKSLSDIDASRVRESGNG